MISELSTVGTKDEIIREKRRLNNRRWVLNNPDRSRELWKRQRIKHAQKRREYSRAYRIRNRDKCAAYNRAWRERNPGVYRRGVRKRYVQNKNCPRFILRTRITNRFYGEVKRGKARVIESPSKLTGCSWDELAVRFESLFQPGMSWDAPSAWHIDHIIPCRVFDLTRLDEQRRCFHYTNLRPLFAKDNTDKGGSEPVVLRMMEMNRELVNYRKKYGSL